MKQAGYKVEVNPLPKSASLVEIEVKIQELGLETASRLYLLEHFGAETIDQLLEREKIYSYVDAMQGMIKTMEDSDGVGDD